MEPRIIAVGLDGTIAEHRNDGRIGALLPGAREFLQSIKNVGFEIDILHYFDNSAVEGWLEENKVPFDTITFRRNYHAIIDQRCVECSPETIDDDYENSLLSVGQVGDELERLEELAMEVETAIKEAVNDAQSESLPGAAGEPSQEDLLDEGGDRDGELSPVPGQENNPDLGTGDL